jgi:DNA-binding protein Fis
MWVLMPVSKDKVVAAIKEYQAHLDGKSGSKLYRFAQTVEHSSPQMSS